MSHSLTYGYNALLSIAELVMNRQVGAAYDEMTIADTFTHDIDEASVDGVEGRAQYLISKPHIAFDATLPNRNTVLSVDSFIGFISITKLPDPLPPDLQVEGEIRGSLQIQFNFRFPDSLDPSSGTLRLDIEPDFSDVTEGDITITLTEPDPVSEPTKSRLAVLLMTKGLIEALRNGDFLDKVSLELDAETLQSDRAEAAIYNDISAEDRDNLIVAFDSDPVTGNASDDIRPFLEPGTLFTLRLSRELAENLVYSFVNDRFMRFSLRAVHVEHEEHFIRISAPDANNLVMVEGLLTHPQSLHRNVSGKIRNISRDGEPISFSTDSYGRFFTIVSARVGEMLEFHGDSFSETELRKVHLRVAIEQDEHMDQHIMISIPNVNGRVTLQCDELLPPGLPGNMSATIQNLTTTAPEVSFTSDEFGRFSVSLEASIGDTLEIRGRAHTDPDDDDHIIQYPPSIAIRNGSIRIKGKSKSVNAITTTDVTAKYEVDVVLDIDAATGMIVSSADAEVDLPGWLDVLIYLGSFFTGGLTGWTVYHWLEKEIEREIEATFNVNSDELLVGVGNQHLNGHGGVRFFPEQLSVRDNGIILSGQIEAGRIREAGRTADTTVTLARYDRFHWEPPLPFAIFSNEDRDHVQVGVSCRFEMLPDYQAVNCYHGEIEYLGKVEFEQLGIDDLRDPSLAYRDRTLPLGGSLDAAAGRVFAVRTTGNHYAKVRVDRQHDGEAALRWVTYESPIEPGVEIRGEWYKSLTPPHHGPYEWHGADRYWANLELNFTRLHNDQLPEIRWTYDGPGTFTINANDPSHARLDVDTIKLDAEHFDAILKVEVTDIFGRSVEATRDFIGYMPYGTLQGDIMEIHKGSWDIWVIPWVCRTLEATAKLDGRVRGLEASVKALHEFRADLLQLTHEIEQELDEIGGMVPEDHF